MSEVKEEMKISELKNDKENTADTDTVNQDTKSDDVINVSIRKNQAFYVYVGKKLL